MMFVSLKCPFALIKLPAENCCEYKMIHPAKASGVREENMAGVLSARQTGRPAMACLSQGKGSVNKQARGHHKTLMQNALQPALQFVLMEKWKDTSSPDFTANAARVTHWQSGEKEPIFKCMQKVPGSYRLKLQSASLRKASSQWWQYGAGWTKGLVHSMFSTRCL